MDENLDLPGEYEGNRQSILDDFARKLKDDPKTIIYDEDEWIEIADYALDVDNRFLFAEAVIWGLSAYPFSRGLRDREAIFLSEIMDMEDCIQAFKSLAMRPNASRLAKIYNYQVKNDGIAPESFYRGMKKLVLAGDPLPDHEVIEVLKIITDAGALQMVMNDISLWEKSVAYTQTLWYEIAVNALDSEDFEIGLKIIDKLLGSHPYNADYWMLKGRLAIGAMTNCMDDRKYIELTATASEAIDTVLAIRPNDPDAKQLLRLTGQATTDADQQTQQFSDETIRLFKEAIETENHEAVKQLSRQIPLSWFNQNMSFMMYLGLESIGNERTNEIFNSWIEYTLGRINMNDINLTGVLPENTALVSIAEIFIVYKDWETFLSLYEIVEKISKKLKLPNPLDIQYAILCLEKDDKKNFVKIYNRLEKQPKKNALNFSLLTLIKDITESNKSMANDASYELKRLTLNNLENVILLKGALSPDPVSPSIVSYLTTQLFQSKIYDKK